MDTPASEPESLIALKNWRARLCLPSEVYSEDFKNWAHAHGAYLYLVLVGPRTEIRDLVRDRDGWKVHAAFHDGRAMKPRTVCVPFDVLPSDSTQLINGVIESSEARSFNAAQVARLVLDRARDCRERLDNWHRQTMRKFFTYRVEYIGQAYGKDGERTAAERIGQGHETVQRVLAEAMDKNPNAAVGFMALDAHIQGRELHVNIGPDNVDRMNELARLFLSEPDGPLADTAKMITVAEAMLIRSFPEARNKQYKQYKQFPLKDAPTLVGELLRSGISHVGVEIDVSESMALIESPNMSREPRSSLRFGVNLATGERETLHTSSPFSWQAE